MSDVRITNLNSYEEPVELRAGFEIERYATSYTDGLRFRPMLVGYQMENPFEDSDRDLPVTLNAPEHVQVSYDIALPRGFAAASGRESHTLDMPGAVFEESYDMQTGKLNYEYTIDIGRQHFPVEQFDQLYRVYERWVELSNSYWLIES